VGVNGALIFIIMFERSTWGMNDREKSAFENFKTLNPGQFRRINRAARWTVAPYDTEILNEGQASENLYFIEAEMFIIVKDGRSFTTKAPAFAGELMFLQGGTASATVIVPKGAVYAEWPVARLRKMMDKSQALQNALVARFSHDMADKVRNSVPMAEVMAQAAE
jgi:CRP-like cAMP-binding protein